LILTDTSVWSDHFGTPDASLMMLLDEELILGHHFVTGELAMSRFKNREITLVALADLPQSARAEDDEVVRFVTQNKLQGLGLSYIDVHLLVSALLTPGTLVWTRDKSLRNAAELLGVAAKHLR
jgi:predicted nucleic acid-binding protein